MDGGLPDDIPDRIIAATEIPDGKVPAYKLAVVCGFATSNGDARRLISGGGLRLNQQKLTDPNAALTIKTGDIVQRGKREFVRIVIQ